MKQLAAFGTEVSLREVRVAGATKSWTGVAAGTERYVAEVPCDQPKLGKCR